MRRINVWLDDVRSPPDGYDAWCGSAELMIKFLDTHWGRIDKISLDHDLGEESYGTGYDVVKFIEEKVFAHSYEPTFNILVHSQNPVGRKNMLAGINSINKRRL